MALMWLIHEWLLRLTTIRTRLREDARDSQAWMLRIHARILRFLVNRYDAGPGARPEQDRECLPLETTQHRTFCIVTPEDHPPRRRSDLGHLLRSVHRINQAKRPRWRWWP